MHVRTKRNRNLCISQKKNKRRRRRRRGRRDLYVALYPEIALEEANALGVTTPMVIFQPQM